MSARGGAGRSGLPWIAALVAGACAMLPWLAQAHWDMKPDSATYLLAARSLARGEGYSVMGEPFTLRPPGFSLLLAPLVAWRGIDFPVLHLAGEAFGIAAIALFFLLLRPRVGDACSFAAAATLWLQPGFQLLCNQALSDVPGLALALLALLATRWSARAPSPARDVAAAASIAAASWLRTANLLLVPALVLERLLAPVAPVREGPAAPAAASAGDRVRHAVRAALLALAGYAPWALQPAATGTYAQDALRSYGSALLRVDPVDPTAGVVGAAELWARLSANATAYVGLLGMTDDGRPTALAWLAAGIAAVAWMRVAARRREAPEWFAGLTAAAIAVYYVAQARLVLTVGVLALGAIVDEARRLLLAVMRPAAANAVVVAALAALASASFRTDFMRPGSAERFADLQQVARYVRTTTTPHERRGGDYGTVYALLLDRPVHGLQFLCNQRGEAAARAAIARWSLDRLVLHVDGPCSGLLDGGRAEARFGAFVVLRLEGGAATATGKGAVGGRTPRADSAGGRGDHALDRRAPPAPDTAEPR